MSAYVKLFAEEVSDEKVINLEEVKWYLSCLFGLWYVFVLTVVSYGWLEIITKFRNRGHNDRLEEADKEPVTIIRPCKGVDAEMEACLESSILQDYPRDKIEVIFAVSNVDDATGPISIIKSLLAKYPGYDIKLLIGEDDYGINPKVNNLTKAYMLAKHDIIWIMDSNVWSLPKTLSQSVASLQFSLDNGRKTKRPVVLTHHLPVGISLRSELIGDRLEETFLSTAHCKLYVAINKLSLLPCVNGKSNLFRRSALDEAVHMIGEGKIGNAFKDKAEIEYAKKISTSRDAVSLSGNKCVEITFDGSFQERIVHIPTKQPNHGIGFFARYYGEDNMIGTALWESSHGRTAMIGHSVYQPLDSKTNKLSFSNYVNRRVRWIRVRKYMDLLPTLLEPLTESILLGAIGAFGIPRIVPALAADPKKNSVLFFVLHMIIWCFMDRMQYNTLFPRDYRLDDFVNEEASLPYFLDYEFHYRYLTDWFMFWVLREALSFPIWLVAMCGSKVTWRGKEFKVNLSMPEVDVISHGALKNSKQTLVYPRLA
ncbi:HEL021Wp [Eremothecium sinecaudum]|uniref:Ceramide glucosyltransferase n=1 Tax=Eremothecium sinecaudum TaxID=45286 RepID=A0A0X8HTP0_9SACH|nr:HEL021Wp [Eremothecium sinecaudum]AMD21259.1 HEL021Wp [Eremothecium sinecaudum]